MVTIKVQAPPALSGQDRLDAASAMTRSILRAADKLHGWKPTEGPAWGPLGTCWYVPSVTQPRQARTLQIKVGADGVLWVQCSCPGSYYRTECAETPTPVNCWHGGALMSWLFEQGRVKIVSGLFCWKGQK